MADKDTIIDIVESLVDALHRVPLSLSQSRLIEIKQRLRTVEIEHDEVIRLAESFEGKADQLIEKGLLTLSAGKKISESDITEVQSQNAAESISKHSNSLDHAMSLSTQCEDLRARLQLPIFPILETPCLQLPDLLKKLQESSRDLEKMIRIRAERIKALDELLENMGSLELEKMADYLDQLKPSKWVQLLEALQDISSSQPYGKEVIGSEVSKKLQVFFPAILPLIFNRIATYSLIEASAELNTLLYSVKSMLSRNDFSECAAMALCLRFLPRHHLADLALDVDDPEVSSQAVAVLIIDALALGESQHWKWLGIVEHSKSVRPEIASLAHALFQHIHDEPGSTLLTIANTLSSEKPVDRKDSYQKRLIETTFHVGMNGNFHKLREAIRESLLILLRPHIEKGDSRTALATWTSEGGSVEDIVAHAVEKEKYRNLEDKHLRDTKRWLESFERDLRTWATLAQENQRKASDELFQAMKPFQESKASPDTDLIAFITQELKTLIASGNPNAEEKLHVRVNSDSRIHIRFLKKWHFASWLDAASNESGSRLSAVLADTLRVALEPSLSQVSFQDLVQTFLTNGQFDVVASIAEHNTELQEPLKKEFDSQWDSKIKPFTETLSRAEQIRRKDELVSLCLDELNSAKGNLDISGLRPILEELTQAVESFGTVGNAEYDRLSTILRDEGLINESDEIAMQEMREKAEDLLQRNQERRCYIILLKEYADDVTYPEPIVECLQAVIVAADLPSKWLDAEDAVELRDATAMILDFWKRKYSLIQKRPEQINELNTLMTIWLKTQFSFLGSDRQVEAIEAITNLGLGVSAEGWETADVVEYIGPVSNEAIGSTEDHTQNHPEKSHVPEANSSPKPVTWSQPKQKASRERLETILTDLRSFIEKTAKSLDTSVEEVSEKALRIALQKENWAAAFVIAHDLDSKKNDPLQLTPLEVTQAVTAGRIMATQSVKRTSEVFIHSLVSITWALSENKHIESYTYIHREELERDLIQFFLTGASSKPIPLDEVELRVLLCSTLENLQRLPTSDIKFQFVVRVLSSLSITVCPERQRTGAEILVHLLWDSCTGATRVAEPRAALVLLLYRLSYIDNLVASLAKKHARSLEGHIVQYMKAAQAAEANPDAWEDARRIAQSFFEQAPETRMKPWRKAIDDLRLSDKGVSDEAPCAISLETASLDDKYIVLEVVVSPSAHRYPENLSITVNILGSEQNNPMEIDFCSGQCISRPTGQVLRLPIEGAKVNQEAVSVSYRIIGQSTGGKNIDIRGRWDINLNLSEAQPFEEFELDAIWPGAIGDPVAEDAFHGRKKESELLKTRINGQTGQQKSAVIIGQRRIGKTSLLKELMQNCAVDGMRTTGVVVNLGGIQKHQTENLAAAFFQSLTAIEGDAAGHNDPVCILLEKQLGSKWNRELKRDLHPEESIETALTRYVNRMRDASGGKITRIAFFIDEFQSIFKFPTEEIDALMWSLRPIVQTSRTISLIMAGSGLTRDLVDGYSKAFFGSVKEVPLQGFLYPENYEAIQKTLLPDAVLDRLCPKRDQLKSLVETAYKLTQGHPWYLAMLGYSAARFLKGRPITAALLHQVAEKMVRFDNAATDIAVGAPKFYGHIFDNLDAFPSEQACAKLVLSNIARQVSIEWDKLSIEKAIHGLVLDRTNISERERLDALKRLENDGIIERIREENGKPVCRIKTPLVAEAIRYDADSIEEDALLSISHLGGDTK